MSYGWCRPCTSWDVYDGESLAGNNETMTTDASGVPIRASSNNREEYMTHEMLSSLSNDSRDSSYSELPLDKQSLRILDCDNPYKIEYFERQLFQHEPCESRKNVVLNTLKELGVQAYVVDEMAVKDTSDIILQVNHVINSIEQDSKTFAASSTLGMQRCLLYQDQQSRLFNLVFTSDSAGQRRRWEEHLESFSTVRAMSAFVILLRSFPGLLLKAEAQNHRSLYFAILIGLILADETSLTNTNMGLLVRNTPTHCALLLRATIRSDLLRKACILSFVFGASTFDWTQTVFTSVGVTLACLLLIINIGARSWFFLGLTSLKRDRIGGSSLMPFLLSLFTGFFLSFLSSRVSASGGKRSIEHIVCSSLCVAVVMIVTNLDRVQKLVVINDEVYGQEMINLILGSWWTISVLGSLFFAVKKRNKPGIPDGEHFLLLDGASPLGYRVPSLPRFEVDEKLFVKRGDQAMPSRADFLSAVAVVVVVAAIMGVVSFTKVGSSVL